VGGFTGKRIRLMALRLALVLTAVGILVAAPVQVALACSCGLGDLRDGLAEADAAFVGELIGKTPRRPGLS
jgi:hypothetical protein